jgi:CPA1 family monovalent cation:H+ antiporter
VFGAMVAATDPVSVVALFRQMGIDKRLTTILEGESLFNDGTAVVLFNIVLAMAVSGKSFSAGAAVMDFLLVVVGGAAVGSLIGYVASRITSLFEDYLLEITLTVVTAYGAFLVAERLHVSPVIAVTAAGIVFGNYGSRTGMTATTRLAVNSFWEYAAFLVNSLLFLLMGMQIEWPLLLQHSRMIGMGVMAVIVARMLVIYGICPFVSSDRLPIPDKWRHLLFWGGLRGALVMALALSLPLNYPGREAMINMTFGVVLFTLLVPGLTMEPLVRALGMIGKNEKVESYQEIKSLLLASKAELKSLDEMKETGHTSERVHATLAKELKIRISKLEHQLAECELTDRSLDELNSRITKKHLLETRKDYLGQLARSGALTEESLHRLRIDVDSELDRLEAESHHAPRPLLITKDSDFDESGMA